MKNESSKQLKNSENAVKVFDHAPKILLDPEVKEHIDESVKGSTE